MAVSSATGLEFTSGQAFYDNIIRDYFLDAVADTVIYPNELLRMLERSSMWVSHEGKNVVYPIHTSGNVGVNAIASTGNLPDPGSQGYSKYTYPMRYLYGRILVDGLSHSASRSDVASWLRDRASEIKGVALDMSRLRNRCFHNDGSGRLAEIDSGGGTTTLLLKANSGIESPTTVDETAFPPTTFITAGRRYMMLASGGTSAEVVTVTSVDDDDQITVPVNATANGDWIVEVSSTASTSTADSGYKNEPQGLAGIFSDANPSDGVATGFQGVDSSLAANSWHRATIQANGGTARALTEALLQKAWSTAIKTAESNIDCLMSSFGMVNTYIDLLVGDKRFVNTTKLEGGSTAITFNGTPWVADRDCYSNRVYFIDKSNLMVHVMADPTWIDDDGAIFHRLEDKHKFQAALYCWEQLGVGVRDKCVLLTDVTEL